MGLSSAARRPFILFAHGAGAGSAHPWMQSWAQQLGSLGTVETFDYPYMREGRRRPDRLPVLVEAHREALLSAGPWKRGPVVLAGKSMGSRVGCHLSLEQPVAGLVCFGYPLVGAGPRRPVRDEVLRSLAAPILFVQGTRDKLCPLDHLQRVRDQMRARSALYVVEDGDHSLQVTKRQLKQSGETQQDVDERILEAVALFLASL